MTPLWLGVAATLVHPRLKGQLPQRLGRHGAAVQPGAVWIHGASVGEVRAAEALWHALSGPKLLTTDTAEGLATAQGFARGAAALLPIDHPLCLAPLWADARPRGVVFVEGAWWPALARRAHRAGVPVLRVSGKVGDRTRRVPAPLLRRWWRHLSAVSARDEAQQRFFAQVLPETEVVCGGDLKVSLQPAPSPLRWHRPFVAGASLRSGDAARLVAARPQGHQLLVAPRHPERFDRSELGPGRWLFRSEGAAVVPVDADGLVLDTLGELGSCLQGAAAVFVGGTFDPAVGGHSPREALAWGCPVVAGPHVHAAPEAFVGVRRAVDVASLGDQLSAAACDPPGDSAHDPSVAREVARWVERHLGPPAPESSPRPWLAPLTPVVAVGATLARRRPRRRLRVDVPVISVGSTNARSPGRTSSVAFLARQLVDRGHRVGVATRGYRRRARGLAVSWSQGGWEALGDEGAMLAALPSVVVAACADRRPAVQALVDHGCSVVLLDDGLQSHEVERDVELVVVDARFPTARGLLPAGERREWRSVPRRADVVWVHHGERGIPVSTGGPAGEAVHRVPGGWTRDGVPCEAPEGPLCWFVGVGHPGAVLSSHEGPVADLWLAADHEWVDPGALRRWLDGRPLATTAKDRARLPDDLAAAAWVRCLRLEGPDLSWLPVVRGA